MAQDKEVVVTIDETGNIEVEALNFHGVGCKAMLNCFNSIGKVTNEVIKDEYYRNNINNNVIDNKKG